MTGERFMLDPNIKALLHDLRVSPARVLRRASLPADLFARDLLSARSPAVQERWTIEQELRRPDHIWPVQ